MKFNSLDPLRSYDKETIQLELPGDKTLFDIQWLSVFDLETNENFGSILIPNGLNVPPSLITVEPHIPSLPNCKQLHKDLKVSWDVFGHAITFELSGRVREDEYMSFGISGSEQRSQMLQSDVVVAYIDGHRGYSTDYAISSLAPVIKFFSIIYIITINLNKSFLIVCSSVRPKQRCVS